MPHCVITFLPAFCTLHTPSCHTLPYTPAALYTPLLHAYHLYLHPATATTFCLGLYLLHYTACLVWMEVDDEKDGQGSNNSMRIWGGTF